jgi:hypothetical protein
MLGAQLSTALAVGGPKSKSILQYFLHFGVLYGTLKYFSTWSPLFHPCISNETLCNYLSFLGERRKVNSKIAYIYLNKEQKKQIDVHAY